jgi:hypothetical protein
MPSVSRIHRNHAAARFRCGPGEFTDGAARFAPSQCVVVVAMRAGMIAATMTAVCMV